MKYLVLLIVLVIAYALWRNARIERRKERAAAPPPAAQPGPQGPQEMVSCAVCAVHLPRGDALIGANGLPYCSQEHRLSAGG